MDHLTVMLIKDYSFASEGLNFEWSLREEKAGYNLCPSWQPQGDMIEVSDTSRVHNHLPIPSLRTKS